MKSLIAIVPILFGFASPISSPAQTPASPSFEVISIKPGDTTDPRGIRGGGCRGADTPNFMAAGPIVVPTGRCLYIGATLKSLISQAYGLEIEGVSGWMDSDHFEVQGEGGDPSSVTRAQLIQMLQQLLSDRFKLKFHRGTREIPAYDLVVARNGPKLKDALADGPRGTRATPGQLTGQGNTSAIAFVISRSLGSPVTDNTGLKGVYQIDLKWAPDPIGTGPAPAPSDPSGPSIFTALQEQLGLRLEPKKSTVAVLVIDSAEKPNGNQ
jgi:uncharacterized protein (TIGR03435 family)